MLTIVIALHIITCTALVIVVLLQQGKGADVGAVFGGSSSTVFGSSGAGGLLTQVTWGLAIVFFTCSIFLAYASTKRVTGSIFEGGVGVPAKTQPSGKIGAPALPKPLAPMRSAPNPVAPSEKK